MTPARPSRTGKQTSASALDDGSLMSPSRRVERCDPGSECGPGLEEAGTIWGPHPEGMSTLGGGSALKGRPVSAQSRAKRRPGFGPILFFSRAVSSPQRVKNDSAERSPQQSGRDRPSDNQFPAPSVFSSLPFSWKKRANKIITTPDIAAGVSQISFQLRATTSLASFRVVK